MRKRICVPSSSSSARAIARLSVPSVPLRRGGVLAALSAEMQLALLAQCLTGRVALGPETVARALVDKTRALVAA